MAPEDGWRKKLYIIIFEADTKLGKLFDVVLLWAILLSVLCLLLESDRGIRLEYGSYLRSLEISFTILFTIEYILRLICVTHPVKYMKSFFGVVDFVSIIPTYLAFFFAGSQYLLVIRAVRLLRIFRVLKLVRYLRESRELLSALKSSRAKITVFLGAVLTLVLIMGTLMHLVEVDNPGFSSIFKGMYWAVVTMTTVGYGDVVPVTTLGKFLSSIIMIMGYGIIAVPTGIVSAEMANASLNKGMQNKLYDSTIEDRRCQICQHIVLRDANYCHSCGQSAK